MGALTSKSIVPRNSGLEAFLLLHEELWSEILQYLNQKDLICIRWAIPCLTKLITSIRSTKGVNTKILLILPIKKVYGPIIISNSDDIKILNKWCSEDQGTLELSIPISSSVNQNPLFLSVTQFLCNVYKKHTSNVCNVFEQPKYSEIIVRDPTNRDVGIYYKWKQELRIFLPILESTKFNDILPTVKIMHAIDKLCYLPYDVFSFDISIEYIRSWMERTPPNVLVQFKCSRFEAQAGITKFQQLAAIRDSWGNDGVKMVILADNSPLVGECRLFKEAKICWV